MVQIVFQAIGGAYPVNAIFEFYNERFSGTYPNIKYHADVRFCLQSVKSTYSHSVHATNTLRCGGMSNTVRMDYDNINTSPWYHVGSTTQNMGCRRSSTFSYGCSISGWPNASSIGTITTPTIALPSFDGKLEHIDVTSAEFSGVLKSNPYGLYILRLYQDGKFYSNRLDKESVVIDGLAKNTGYTASVEVWLADQTGSKLADKKINYVTLDEYPLLNITNVEIAITEGETEDTVQFTVSTSDDQHVKSYQMIRDGTTETYDSNTWEIQLPKNTSYTIQFKVIDTLNRESTVFEKTFYTTITYREIWAFDGNKWNKGYSYSLSDDKYELSDIWVFDGTRWRETYPFEEVS